LENGDNSAYKDWFYIKQFPLDAYNGSGDPQNYAGWWNHKSLPKLNTVNPRVRQHIFNVARYWIEQGADGWRLDVPNEINDDGFWEEFRHVVKSTNRDAYLTGEIWDVNPRWANNSHFDGLMNYPVKDALAAFLQGRENAIQFGGRIESLFKAYPRENLFAMYVPLDSHDTERFKTLMSRDTTKLKLAFLFQMAFPGAPAIYYGDEIGMEGDKDPDCRRAFPWRESSWDQGLRQWVRQLISLRKQTAALRRGEFVHLLAEGGLYVFARTLGEQKILIALNASAQECRLEIPCSALGWADGRTLQGLLDAQKFSVAGGKLPLTLPPWCGTWIG
jgi:cyclomaltodextrinase